MLPITRSRPITMSLDANRKVEGYEVKAIEIVYTDERVSGSG